MSAEAWAAVAAWVAAAVTGAGAVTAGLQAKRARQAVGEARGSRRAAEDQATSARESARAARVSADAAAESVKISRDAQHAAGQPHFMMQCGFRDRDRGTLGVRATMTEAGPDRVIVSGTWHTHTEAPPMVGTTEDRVSDEEGVIEEQVLVQGSHLDVDVMTPGWGGREGTRVRLDLKCVDAANTSREWSCPMERVWNSRSPEVF